MQELRGKILKVVKFGGSSVATGDCFAMIKTILDADPSRAIVVVSAPGKRFSSDIKVTDLLYLLRAHIKYNAPYDELVDKIQARYDEICESCGIKNVIREDFENFKNNLGKKTSVDYIASRRRRYAKRTRKRTRRKRAATLAANKLVSGVDDLLLCKFNSRRHIVPPSFVL